MSYQRIKLELKNADKVVKELKNAAKPLAPVLRSTINDFKSRGAGWAAGEISKHYRIKKKDVTEAVLAKKPAGKIIIAGEKVNDIVIIFAGRTLTPIHFAMTPKKEPARKKKKKKQVINVGKHKGQDKYITVSKMPKSYNVSAEIVKGNRKTFKDNNLIFLAPARKMRIIIPWKVDRDSGEIEPIKTISIPQMVTSERTKEDIHKTVSENLNKRFDHYLRRAGLL